MAEGVDYSYDRPSPGGLATAGKRFAVRYVGTPSSGKSLDRAEVNALAGAGIDVVATYETSAGFMLTADGAVAARRALDHAMACGMPRGRPIYFALDVDPEPLTDAQWRVIEGFLDDAARVIGRNAVGVYGGFRAIERLVPDKARWGWQTYAWSRRRWSTKAHLTQYQNGVALAGGTVDLCASKTTDYGQWGRTEEDDMDEIEYRKELLEGDSRGIVKDIVTGAVVDGLRKPTEENPKRGALRPLIAEVVAEELRPVAVGLAKLLAAEPDGSIDEEELASLLAPKLLTVLTPEAIAAAIPDDLAEGVADHLAARLAD